MSERDRLDAERMVDLRTEVGLTLEERNAPEQELIVVGGAYMALAQRRFYSEDVDSLGSLSDATKQAVADVAQQHGLDDRWLNSGPTPWWPDTLTRSMCLEVMRVGRLRVLVPPPQYVFAMKLHAYRPKDYEDLSSLWLDCDFASKEEAIDFYWKQYPHETHDPFMVSLIDDIESRIAHDLVAKPRAGESRSGDAYVAQHRSAKCLKQVTGGRCQNLAASCPVHNDGR